jgi:hypothetical protein
MQMAYTTMTDNLYKETCEIGPGTWYLTSNLKKEIAKLVMDDMKLTTCDEIFIANWLLIGCYKTVPGSVVVVG